MRSNLLITVRTNAMRRLLLAVALLAPGCADDGMTGDDEQTVDCALETRDDDFAVGLSKTGTSGLLMFTLMNATPATPTRGDNTWVIQINQSASGVAGPTVDGASLDVTPYMPDHRHPAGKTVVIEPTGTPGQYELSPINLWMPGLWENTIEASTTGGDDSVVIRVCVPS